MSVFLRDATAILILSSPQSAALTWKNINLSSSLQHGSSGSLIHYFSTIRRMPNQSDVFYRKMWILKKCIMYSIRFDLYSTFNSTILPAAEPDLVLMNLWTHNMWNWVKLSYSHQLQRPKQRKLAAIRNPVKGKRKTKCRKERKASDELTTPFCDLVLRSNFTIPKPTNKAKDKTRLETLFHTTQSLIL